MRRSELMGLIEVAAYAGAAIVLYYLYKKVSTAAGAITSPLATGAANAYAWLTFPAAVSNVNSVKLPDGTIVTVDAIAAQSGIDQFGNFTFNAVPYQISGTDADGYYVAKRLVT
jgi:hypothetical protein